MASTPPKASASPTRHAQRCPQLVSAIVEAAGLPSAASRPTSCVVAACMSSCAQEAARSRAAASSAIIRDRSASAAPSRRTGSAGLLPVSAGRTMTRTKKGPPTMAMAPSSSAHRTTGSAGDWSSPLSTVATGASEIGSPTEKRKEPRTRWPSTVETFLHATVYVPSGRGASPTDNPAGSSGSWMLSPSSTLPPPASSTRISLRPGSTGSVNRTTTRAGASFRTELGAGSADARLAWARTAGAAASAIASTAPRSPARSPAYRRLFSISALAGLMPHPLLLDM